jgi:hypothetical protein
MANSRVYIIKRPDRSGVRLKDLLQFCYSSVGPVRKYACPTWHTSLTCGKKYLKLRSRSGLET